MRRLTILGLTAALAVGACTSGAATTAPTGVPTAQPASKWRNRSSRQCRCL
jgi:Spy/CpxP family protein refolding chaperone